MSKRTASAASNALVQRWARGQELARLRIAKEARQRELPFERALSRVAELRRFADDLGATVDEAQKERENLAYHLTWAKVRRAVLRA